jgi:hypothetical protein
MRIPPNRADVGADVGIGKLNGDGRTADAGDLWASQAHEQLLCSLEISEGAEVGVEPPECLWPVKGGLAMLLRKSV